MALLIGQLLHELVHHKMYTLKWHIHRQLRGVGPIERAQTFSLVYSHDATHDRFVWGIRHLHPLLYDCEQKQLRICDDLKHSQKLN